MRNGQVFERQTLAHPTAGSGSLSWPTVTANTATYSSEGYGENLIQTAEQWQTPATFQGKYRRQVGQAERAELLLPGQAEHWGTPRASSANGSSQKERDEGNPKGRLETGAETWMTPTTRDFKDGDGTANVETNGLLGRQAPRTVMPGQESQNDTGQRLNPIFVTALMGLREGWLDLTS